MITLRHHDENTHNSNNTRMCNIVLDRYNGGGDLYMRSLTIADLPPEQKVVNIGMRRYKTDTDETFLARQLKKLDKLSYDIEMFGDSVQYNVKEA